MKVPMKMRMTAMLVTNYDDGPDSKLLKASEIGKIFTQQQDHQQCQFQNTQNMLTMLTC